MATASPPEPPWEQIRPGIDDALERLDADERASIILRFFEQKTFAVIGEQIGASENAAQKRVARALDQLKIALARYGISSSAAALELTLVQSAVAAPSSFAATVATAALAKPTTAPLFTSKLTALKWFGLSATALAGFTGGIWYQTQTTARPTEPLTAEVDGAEPALRTTAKRATDAQADTARQLRALADTGVTAETKPSPASTRATPPTMSREIYVVRRGDTGRSIGKTLAVTSARLNAANPTYDFSLMMEGDEIIIPSRSTSPLEAENLALRGLTQPQTATTISGYVIAFGDSLETAAIKTGLSAEEITAANLEVNWSRLRAGQEIRLK